MAQLHLYPQPADPVQERAALLQSGLLAFESGRSPARLALVFGLLSALCACSASMDANNDAFAGPSASTNVAPRAPSVTAELPAQSSTDRDDAQSSNPFVMVEHDPLSTFATRLRRPRAGGSRLSQ
jgi:hypothetical protein